MDDYTDGVKGATVLLVEDEAVVALDIASILRQIGYQVPEIQVTGEDAVNAAERLMPDLILMDITLAGDMDGIRAAQEIRKRHDIPLVYLTANADQSTVERARETEPFGYLNKPVSELDLLTNIDTALFKHHMERRLREREERLRLITDNMVDTITQIGADGTIVYSSPSVERNYGYLPEDLIGRPGTELVHPDDLTQVLKIITGAIKQRKESITLEYRWRNAKGKYRWAESMFRFLYDEGRWTTTIVSSRDITKRRRAEDALRESEKQLRLITDNMLDVVSQVDTDRNIVYITPSIERNFGYRPDEIIGHSAVEYVHPDDWPAAMHAIDEAVRAHSPSLILTYRWRGADGEYRHVESLFRFLYDSDDRITSTIVSARDITEREQAEDALRESEELYRLLFELGSDALFIIENETGRILAANSAACSMYGYSNEELLAMKNTDLSAEPEETRSVTTKTAIDPGRVIFIPLRYHRKRDGAKFPVEITGRFFTLQGRPVHIAAIRDITDRVKDES